MLREGKKIISPRNLRKVGKFRKAPSERKSGVLLSHFCLASGPTFESTFRELRGKVQCQEKTVVQATSHGIRL